MSRPRQRCTVQIWFAPDLAVFGLTLRMLAWNGTASRCRISGMTTFTDLGQTLIGAAAAITGGVAGAWWQARYANKVARNIRSEERREEGLLALNAKVVDVAEVVDRGLRAAEREPASWSTAWVAVHGEIAALRTTWEADLAAKIPDRIIVDKYLEARAQAHDCTSRFGTRVITELSQQRIKSSYAMSGG